MDFLDRAAGHVRTLITTVGGLAVLALAAPSPLLSAQSAQELIQERTGRSISQEQILQRLRASGLSRAQVRGELARRGYDPGLADPYFDRLEGRASGDLPRPGSGLVDVVNRLAPPVDGAGGGVGRPGTPLVDVPPVAPAIPTESPGRVQLRHILLSYPPGANPEQRDSVWQRAHRLHLQLLGGASFDRLARERSDDTFTAPRGGDLGWVGRGQLPSGLEEVAFALEPGSVSRPVESPGGVHLLRVEERESLRIFGRSVFSRPTSQFQAMTTGPVAPGYRLGPGDQLVLVLTGDVELAYTLDVTREGYVVIPDVGQLSVNGLTLEQLTDRLYDRLGEVYSGVERGPEASTRFDVSLGRLRTNQVYVIGDVERPGAYQVPSVATVFHALHRAGGPTVEGSFRDVRVRRAGSVAARVDLYGYLVEGDAGDDARLEHGDIVFVPPAGPQVTIRGKVSRPATYELRDGESLSQLLTFAGGLEADAFSGRIQIDRILPAAERTSERERVLLDVDPDALREDGGGFALRDGDRVAVFEISDERRNRVTLRGEVYRPGTYEHLDGETVRGLVERAGGLRPSAYARIAHVRRPDAMDGGVDLLRVALEDGGPADLPTDLSLEDRDEVVVFSVDSMTAADSVRVAGLVREPGAYGLARGMTAEDLILAAGGFDVGADPYRAEVVRRRITVDRSDTLTTRIPVAVSEDIPYPGAELPPVEAFDRSGLVAAGDVPLQPDDRVIVRELPGFPGIGSVRVVGEVNSPGWYVLETRTETMTDLLRRAGGPTSDAYVEGFRLVRDDLPVGVDLVSALDEPHGSEDLPVEPGDSLIVPTYDPTVQVRGGVAFEARVRYRDGWGLDDYLEQAGGTRARADRSQISVEYPNGERAVVQERTLFFDSKPEVRPGSVVYVPMRPLEEDGFDVDRFISRTATVLSAAATVIIAVTRF